MKPGTYLRKRREAAGVNAAAAACETGRPLDLLQSFEAGTMIATGAELRALRIAFRFNETIYHGLVRGLPMTVCRECACSEYDACEGSCAWATEDLCTACIEKAKGAR